MDDMADLNDDIADINEAGHGRAMVKHDEAVIWSSTVFLLIVFECISCFYSENYIPIV